MLKRFVWGVGACSLVFGCASDDRDDGLDAGNAEVLSKSEDEPPGDNCEHGGVANHSGEDDNGDGTLQNREITDTQYECDEPPPEVPEPEFESRLVITQLEIGDPDCPGGGKKIERGTDTNDNLILERREVESSDLFCSPVIEPAERLVVTALPVGDADCPGGGSKLERGVDADADGELNGNEVESTSLICNDVAAPATLARAKKLEAGDEDCPDGGVAVLTGPDTDGDGLLGDDEVTDTSLVCDSPGLVVTCAVPTVWSEEQSGCVLVTDWSGSDLTGAQLGSEYLAGIDFTGADLSGADLSFAELRDADLSGASLAEADLTRASLIGTDLTGALLDGANLEGVDISHAVLDDISAKGLHTCPAIVPEGWNCPDFGATGLTLTWPGMSLEGFDLTGAVLTLGDVYGLQPLGITACPEAVPEGWACLELGDFGLSLVGSSADLGGLDLSDVDLSAVPSLSGTSFVESDLSGAAFGDGANLTWVDFKGANLTGANFGAGSDLSHANLSDTDLTGAIFGASSSLAGATIKRAALAGVDLSGTNLEGIHALSLLSCPAALPSGYSCVGAQDGSFSIAGPATDLSGANLAGANLSGMNLQGANLEHADLAAANLTNADLRFADLREANLTGAIVTGTLVAEAVWGMTICPDGNLGEEVSEEGRCFGD